MKKIILTLLALAAVTVSTFAGDIYIIGRYNSLITARHDDLVTFFQLHGNHAATRAFYSAIEARGGLVNFQPGARVEVVAYWNDGVAEIQDDNGIVGYIAKADLSYFVRSR